MVRRFLVIVALAFAFVASPVAAGGWAVAEIAALPETIRSGEAITIDIRLLQHGITPVEDGAPSLVATERQTVTKISVDGEKVKDQSGLYRFEVTFPVAGTWKWHVTLLPFDGLTAFPSLQVEQGPASATPAVSADAEPASGDSAVSLEGMEFVPARLEIAVGTAVTWTNNDTVPHQVASPDSLDFEDSAMLKPGESYTFTFTQPGEYKIICGPHPNMGMLMVVR
jgi:plastocyanin